MNINKFSIIAMLIFSITLFSCSKDDDDSTAPIVSEMEIGLQNSMTMHQGGELHIEFEVSDNEGLDYYTIEIHPEMKSTNAEWEYENTWYFDGQPKNDMVHHHEIKIAEDADLGPYHFHMKVADINGNITTIEQEVEMHEAVEGDGPEIHVDSHPADDEVFTTGQTISIAGHAHSDMYHIAGMFIGIVKKSDGLANEDVNASNAIVLFHKHDFDETYEVDFDASITVGDAEDKNPTPNTIDSWALGEAYILVKAVDEEGHISFSQHYHIEVNE